MPRLGKTKLAAQLKLTRSNLDGYLNRKDPLPPQPDEKKKYDVDAVVAYIATVRDTDQQNKTVTHWRSEKLRIEVEEKKAKAAREAGDFIAREDSKRVIEAATAEFVGGMQQKFEYELPTRYIGKDAIECAALNANAIDNLIARWKQNIRALV